MESREARSPFDYFGQRARLDRATSQDIGREWQDLDDVPVSPEVFEMGMQPGSSSTMPWLCAKLASICCARRYSKASESNVDSLYFPQSLYIPLEMQAGRAQPG